eukprot:1551292-Karenia_brevis.AAC.1
MNEQILKPLQKIYGNFKRRFKCAGGIGREYKATNGILQGCPLSITLLNALVAVWCHAVKNAAPEAEVFAYVDDTGAVAERPTTLNRVLTVTKQYELATGQQINIAKSFCFSSSSPNMKRLRFGKDFPPRADSFEAVGVPFKLHTA